MQIIKTSDNIYQLIDESADAVMFQGSLEDCQLIMYAEEDKRLHDEFIYMMS